MQVLNGMCSGFIMNSIGIFSLATAAAVLMVVMASAAASLACRHPGDAKAADAAMPLVDDEYVPMTYVGIVEKQQAAPMPYRPGNYQQYSRAPGVVDW
jgi:hypothetical protein